MKCKICNRKFENIKYLMYDIQFLHKMKYREYYDKFIKRKREGVCKNRGCKNKTKFISFRLGYRDYCSSGCYFSDPRSRKIFSEKISQVMKSEEYKERMRQKYGVDYQVLTKRFREKKKQTMLNKYGVESAMQVPAIKEKQKQTLFKKYGVYHPSQFEQFKEKRRQTCLKKYGVDSYFKTDEWRSFMKNGQSPYILSFIKTPSKGEVRLREIVKGLFPTSEHTYKILNYAVDVAIVECKIVVEYDGSYWHRDKEYDDKRQKEIETLGWTFLRYVDYLPAKEQIKLDIENVMKNRVQI